MSDRAVSLPTQIRTGRRQRPEQATERARASVLQLAADVEHAEALLRARVNELLDEGYSYQTVGGWLGISRKTLWRRFVEVQQKLW